ncbi:MAG TPA: TetR/AcrR family transcriptional regulator [Balneolales bacterium]|nr:TetR/AcrR family transcriptional regulator [Balneolales bacterium]
MEKETEEKIFDAARKVFHHRGFYGARMQEIADEADINKSMLHYYFRNKEKLFEEVFRDSFSRIVRKVFEVLKSDTPLFQKVENFVETYIGLLEENPYLPIFVFHEMNTNPEHLKGLLQELNVRPPEILIQQIDKAVSDVEIIPIQPIDFIVNLLSLCVFPFVGKQMIITVFRLDNQQYQEFLKRRKKELSTFIINGLKAG